MHHLKYFIDLHVFSLLSESVVVFFFIFIVITFGYNFSFVDPKLLYQILDLMEALVF